jgi:hypothetical protein
MGMYVCDTQPGYEHRRVLGPANNSGRKSTTIEKLMLKIYFIMDDASYVVDSKSYRNSLV